MHRDRAPRLGGSARLASLCIALFCSACSPRPATAAPGGWLEQEVERATGPALEAYQWFHRHPELSNQEKETAERLARELESIGLEVHRGIGGTGLVAILRGTGAGEKRTVLYRADMDALPVAEQTRLPYQSERPGVMHACGHDVHMAVAVGALRVLFQHRQRFSGAVVFVGQPAEEIGAGARQVLDDPRFAALLDEVGRPSVAFAIHDAANIPAGTVALTGGWHSANVDSVDILVKGKGGHGAKPDETVDPIVIGAEIVVALQTIVSRRLPPGERAVVTVGQFQAGTKRNVIPSEAILRLTVRSYEKATRRRVLSEIRRTAEHIARAQGAEASPKVTVKEHFTPAGYNDPEWTERLRRRFEQALGAERVVEHPPRMTGEDFARYSRRLKIPSVMWRVGATSPELYERRNGKDLPGLHSSEFAPAAAIAIPVGVRSVALALFEALGGRG